MRRWLAWEGLGGGGVFGVPPDTLSVFSALPTTDLRVCRSSLLLCIVVVLTSPLLSPCFPSRVAALSVD